MLSRFPHARHGPGKGGILMTAPDQEPIDLVNALNSGRINRRDFMRRGVLLGLSIPTISALLASCGDDDDNAESTAGSADTGTGGDVRHGGSLGHDRCPLGGGTGTIRVATQKPAAALDPIAMQDLGSYGIIAQCFEFLCTLGDEGDIAAGLAESWEANATAACGRSICARASSGTTAPTSRRPTSPPRSTACPPLTTPASRAYRAGLGRRHRSGDRGRHAVCRRTATSPTSCRCSTPSPSSRPSPTQPARTSTRRQRHRALEAHELRRRHRRRVRPQRRLVGRRAALATADVGVLRRRRVDGDGRGRRRGRRARPVPGGRRRGAVRQPRLQRRRLPGRNAPPDLDAVRHGQFADKRVRQALGYSIDRQALVDTLFKGKADIGNDHVIAPDVPVLRPVGATAHVRRRGGQAAARRCRFPRWHRPTLHFGQPAGDPRAGAADPGPGGRRRVHARARR